MKTKICKNIEQIQLKGFQDKFANYSRQALRVGSLAIETVAGEILWLYKGAGSNFWQFLRQPGVRARVEPKEGINP